MMNTNESPTNNITSKSYRLAKLYPVFTIVIYGALLSVFTLGHSQIYLSSKYEIKKATLLHTQALKDGTFLVYVDEKGSNTDMVHYPGNGFNKNYVPGMATFFQKLPCNQVFPVYRGYGPSTGSPNELRLMVDVLILADILRSRGNRVVVLGFSLGCALSLYLSKVYGGVCKLVLINPFYSLDGIIREQYGRLCVFRYLITEKYENYKRVQLYDKKLLLVVSGRDSITDKSNSYRLRSMSRNGWIVLIPDVDHNSFIDRNGMFAYYLNRYLNE